MAPRILILPTAMENYRLAVRETERKLSPQQAKAYGRRLRQGFEETPAVHARVRNRKDERVGTSLFRLHKIEYHYAAYIVVDETTFVIAAVLHEWMDIPAQLLTVERLIELNEASCGNGNRCVGTPVAQPFAAVVQSVARCASIQIIQW
ncbi:type II toxin-antitoxin system RelE/ParE family toxin [Metarhizobium album]|uniref:Type II toxin-antitoxin system RelE/ParE family toxin n=1 Tax=Metarhizobium album TaxID=2182425 RepID=A0A2U2DSF1_9HYPH|nr:type II toxin-antitoxin system RelE/ParE family toxin [Rhizobium album]PWE56256.1 type II toxin-antitoxin system RelE/ParE family toxin [Rhizobium album]